MSAKYSSIEIGGKRAENVSVLAPMFRARAPNLLSPKSSKPIFVLGGSLAKLLSTHGPLEEKVAIKYTQQIIRGVAYLHEHHVIHRDIKGMCFLSTPR